MLKNKEVENKEGEEQSSSYQKDWYELVVHTSQEENLMWNLKTLNRNATEQRLQN